jgi:DNA-binding transcriptional ArsR family regulator
MSGLLAGKVWQSNLDSHLKPLAAAMADIANDDGSSIFPSVAYLAWLLGKGERSVQHGLSELKELGIIEAVAFEKGGRNHTTEYRLIEDRLPYRIPWKEIRKGATSAPFTKPKGENSGQERVQLSTQRVQSAAERVKPAAPDPSVDPSVTVKEPSAHSRLMDFIQRRNGPIANGGKEGKDAKWLLEHYNPEECERCFDFLASQDWRDTAVTWATVRREIGPYLKKADKTTSAGEKILTDFGDWYTVEGADGTPSKRYRTPEAFARETGRDLEEVRAHWN